MSEIPYRKDIDGLRAVAVSLVIAYHFGIARITGGYIGVDVFFVISGFLIASIFNRQPQLSLTFLGNFYNRRIKRLMPAFIFIATVITVVASGLLLPEDFNAYLQSVRESMVFRSNYFFERETTGYFATNSAELPWLHTWSLSVEWQFYFAFPLFVWLSRRLAARQVQVWIMLGATFLGVAVSIAMTASQPTHAYFSAPARFFEFSLGALATFVETPKLGRRTSQAITAACVAALVALAGTFVKQSSFPGLNALVVCMLGFVTIIVGRNASVLSSDWLAHLGKLSYSAYLWHWPVIALLNYVQRKPSTIELVVWIVAIIAASELTYRFVERPGMAANWKLSRSFLLWCLLPALSAASVYLVVRNHGGYPQRLGAEAEHAYMNLQYYESRVGERCHDYTQPDIEPCVIGDPHGRVEALLIGDSHARHFRPLVQIMAEQAHIKVYSLTNGECLTLEGVLLPERYALRQACGVAIVRDLKLIHSGRFRYVLIAERWTSYPPEQLARLEATVQTIIEAGAVPVLFKSVAENGENMKDCFYRHIKIRRPFLEGCAIPFENDYAKAGKRYVDDLIDAVKARHPSLIVIDLQSVQCDRGSCETVIDGTPMYLDTHHLNAFGSAMLAYQYLARFGNPLETAETATRRGQAAGIR